MATPRLGRALTTCPNCLGRLPLARPTAAIAPSPSPLQLGLTQVRHASKLTKAELEDLQGIPVRLLKNINGFGKQSTLPLPCSAPQHGTCEKEGSNTNLPAPIVDAIIRVKPGRMRNQWHHKGLAEYMTKKRFTELGLTEAAIGVRDRTFGSKLLTEEDVNGPTIAKDPAKSKKKEQIVMTVCDLLLVSLQP